MKSVNGGITNLEKQYKRFAKELTSMGYECNVSTFRCGNGGFNYYGPSFCELVFVGNVPYLHHSATRIYAGGYGEVIRFSEFKKTVLAKLIRKNEKPEN